MKKGIGVLLLGLILLLAACGDDETSSAKDMSIKNPFKESTIRANSLGDANLEGNAPKGSKVKLDNKTIKVEQNGSFVIPLENNNMENENYSVEVTLQNGHWNAFMVTVEPSLDNISASIIPKNVRNFITKYNEIATEKKMNMLNSNPLLHEDKDGGYYQILMDDSTSDSKIIAQYNKDFKFTGYNFMGGKDLFYGFYMLTALGIEKEVHYFEEYSDSLINKKSIFAKDYETSHYKISVQNTPQIMLMDIKLK